MQPENRVFYSVYNNILLEHCTVVVVVVSVVGAMTWEWREGQNNIVWLL